jgi:hypothetical protein
MDISEYEKDESVVWYWILEDISINSNRKILMYNNKERKQY